MVAEPVSSVTDHIPEESSPSPDSSILEDISEAPQPRLSRDWTFWLVLVFAVLPIWSIVPLSWAFVIYTLRTGTLWTLSYKGGIGFCFALAEVFFSVYHYQLARSISGPSIHGPGDLTELQTALRRVLQSGLAGLPEYGYDEEDVGRPGSPGEDITPLEFTDPRAIDFRNYLRNWFNRVPWSSIRKHQMYQWLHWSIFNGSFHGTEHVSEARKQVLEEVIELIERRAGAKIPDGSNPASTPMLLTLDPVNVMARPFIWYLGVALSNYYQRRQYESRWGCVISTYKGLDYILRIPPHTRHDARPIVFLHGLGLGLTQYKLFLTHLLKAVSDRPILIPLQPHVSQEIFHPRYLRPMGRHDIAESLGGLLVELGWVREPSEESSSETEDAAKESSHSQGVTVVSHSNGSFLHAWLLKAHPRMVSRSCFVDPVTFCSWEGDLCYNFIYRSCSNGLELLMKYFVGTELGVANFLQRHFDWNANALWYEQIPNARDPSKTMFFLGGKDAIVAAERVKRYLTSHGVRKGLWFDPDGRHGQALLAGGEGHTEILRWLGEKEC